MSTSTQRVARRSTRAVLAAVILMAVATNTLAQERYLRAAIDQEGQLRIVTSRGREIVPAKQTDQVGFDKVAVSPDGRAVGWVALFPNCCTSYPIPLELVVLRDGRRQTFTGSGLPVWRWMFADNGNAVAFRQETVHGGLGVHYELRELSTGRLLAAFDPGADTPQEPPDWAQAVDAHL